MRFLTCNIRTSGANDGENSWPYRKELCVDVIRSQSPDVVFFQEMTQQQLAYIVASIPGYGTYAMADRPTGPHPKNCIFYRSEVFTLISAGGYWLSETPHVAGSKSWDSAHIRLANWVRLEDNSTGAEFRAINTHLDNKSQLARERQAWLIVEDSLAYPDAYPQIVAGDMNCGCESSAIGAFKGGGWRDTYAAVHGTENPGRTHHAFLGQEHEGNDVKIDWIFVRGAAEPEGAEIIRDSRDGRFPSDHFFVSADVAIQEAGDDN